MRSASSTKFGIRSRSRAERLLDLGPLAEHSPRCRGGAPWSPVRRRRRWWPPGDIVDIGCGPVGERGGGQPGEYVVARLASAILDVRVNRSYRNSSGLCASESSSVLPTPGSASRRMRRDEVSWSPRGHAEQVGDHQEGERLGEATDELALAAAKIARRAAGRRVPHGLLVLLQPFGRDQSHQQRAMIRMRRWVEGRQLVAERQLMAVLSINSRDVVAVERHREARKRPRHRDA